MIKSVSGEVVTRAINGSGLVLTNGQLFSLQFMVIADTAKLLLKLMQQAVSQSAKATNILFMIKFIICQILQI